MKMDDTEVSMKTADQMVRELCPYMGDDLVTMLAQHAIAYAGIVAKYALEQKTVGAVKQVLGGAADNGHLAHKMLTARRDALGVTLTPIEEAAKATRKASQKRRK
jgi:hypothetical protein